VLSYKKRLTGKPGCGLSAVVTEKANHCLHETSEFRQLGFLKCNCQSALNFDSFREYGGYFRVIIKLPFIFPAVTGGQPLSQSLALHRPPYLCHAPSRPPFFPILLSCHNNYVPQTNKPMHRGIKAKDPTAFNFAHQDNIEIRCIPRQQKPFLKRR